MDRSDGSLQFDERVCCVVLIQRRSFAVGAEIGVRADSTLVSGTTDAGCVSKPATDGPVTVYTKVCRKCFGVAGNQRVNTVLLVDGNETMARMDL